MIGSAEPCEPAAPGDPHLNYCLWPYAPAAATAGTWRPSNLLLRSFQVAGAHPNHREVMAGLRRRLGNHATVWGVKWDGSALGWEHYFYDYERRGRSVSLACVLDVVRSWAASDLGINESLPYFMFSLDFDDAVVSGARPLDRAHVYIGNPGGLLSSGISYELTATGFRMENLYSFFDARDQLHEAGEKVCCSVRVDAAEVDLDAILRPELRSCDSICVANKPSHDTVYFSGVDTDQLLFFLEWLKYPADLTDYVRRNRNRFRPLRHDVGFDYVCDGAAPRILKSGFYGVF